jgi:hypothetical protein
LASVLERRLGVGVYPFAPRDFKAFTRDTRFNARPPAVVVFSSIERELPRLEPAADTPWRRHLAGLRVRLMARRALRRVAVVLDRAMKTSGLRYLRALAAGRPEPIVYGGTLFLQGPSANSPVSGAAVESAASRLREYDLWCRQRGMRFIFFPIPNKENIDYDLLPGKTKPAFLRDLLARLSAQGVESVDTQSAFEKAHGAQGQELYLPDDSHWNATAVRLTAGLLADEIELARGGGR